MSDMKMRKFAQREMLDKLLQTLEPGRKSTRLGTALNMSSPGMLKEGMSVANVFARFPDLRPQLENGVEATSVLLMCDLSPFSTVIQGWTPKEIVSFLDRYYRGVVDKVTERGGVVEKYIGDAVIAAFGSPFDARTTVDHIHNVVALAMTLTEDVAERFDGAVSLKSAIAVGQCFYGYVGHEQHKELTIIGAPLTELFRLEGVCAPSSVILRSECFNLIRNKFEIREEYLWELEGVDISWDIKEEPHDLRGVGNVETVSLVRR